MDAPGFIQSQHPKNSIASTPEQFRDLLKMGWIAQPKMNGHRMQIHIGPKGQLVCYTRKGQLHTAPLTTELESSFQSYVDKEGWIVFEGEWIKYLNQIFLFDILRIRDNTLMFSSYKERYKLLKNTFSISPNIKLLRNLTKEADCLKVMGSEDKHIEGLVFKAWETKGWPDTAIVRCLKEKE